MDCNESNTTICKYCTSPLRDLDAEGLQCCECKYGVHLKCLKRGSVPGGLIGDVFFQFTCELCSSSGSENFTRDKMPWLQAIILVLFHMQTKSPGIARKGFFHWKIHIAAFIDKHWDQIFRKDFKRRKKWTGTVSGTLSHYSPHFFKSGTMLFNEQGWWTLTYPKLTPKVIIQLNTELMQGKPKTKEENIVTNDAEILHKIILSKSFSTDVISPLIFTTESFTSSSNEKSSSSAGNDDEGKYIKKITAKHVKHSAKRKSLLPTIDSFDRIPPKKMVKKENSSKIVKKEHITMELLNNVHNNGEIHPLPRGKLLSLHTNMHQKEERCINNKYTDPMCHYNTSIKNLSRIDYIPLKTKLMGNVRQDLILSPYSGLHLKPYIRRDSTSNCNWLRLMAELQCKVNQNKPDYKLQPRYTLDYVYVQPEHIPAINSLCNQFFWTGIDMTESLQYPDFSCIVMYRKLVVAFAFLVPDVNINENYMSFIFTRPAWRNAGIGKFMLYHLIQMSAGRDITLNVSISNSALLLYQKFGFKVEKVVLDFYDKYFRKDSRECKHAYFCRLER